MFGEQFMLTYLYLLVYILLSSGVILYNKWVLSPKYFNFPYPITLTMIHMGFSGIVAFILVRVLKMGERRGKTLKEIREQLATKQPGIAATVDKQIFWESSSFKMAVSMSMLILVVFAKQ